MSDYYCPQCGADLEDQPGFDPYAGYWTCTECGQFLTDPDDSDGSEQFDGVGWFCDNCGAYLNKQPGFSDWFDTWNCTECGHENRISEDEIYDSEEDWRSSKSSSLADDDDDDDDDDDEEDEEDEEDETESYYDSEEYQRRRREEALRKEEELRRKQEARAARERERAEIARQKQEQRKRFWRTITRKKQDAGISSEQCIGMPYQSVVNRLTEREFTNITASGIEDLDVDNLSLEGTVASISINGETAFDSASRFTFGAKIEIIYHLLKRAGSPLSAREARKQDIDDVIWEFTNAGFMNIKRDVLKDLIKGWIVKDGSVEKVTIDGKAAFKRNEKFRINAPIVIQYHTFKKDKK